MTSEIDDEFRNWLAHRATGSYDDASPFERDLRAAYQDAFVRMVDETPPTRTKRTASSSAFPACPWVGYPATPQKPGWDRLRRVRRYDQNSSHSAISSWQPWMSLAIPSTTVNVNDARVSKWRPARSAVARWVATT